MKKIFLLFIFLFCISFTYSATFLINNNSGINKWNDGTFFNTTTYVDNFITLDEYTAFEQELPANSGSNDWVNMSDTKVLLRGNNFTSSFYYYDDFSEPITSDKWYIVYTASTITQNDEINFYSDSSSADVTTKIYYNETLSENCTVIISFNINNYQTPASSCHYVGLRIGNGTDYVGVEKTRCGSGKEEYIVDSGQSGWIVNPDKPPNQAKLRIDKVGNNYTFYWLRSDIWRWDGSTSGYTISNYDMTGDLKAYINFKQEQNYLFNVSVDNFIIKDLESDDATIIDSSGLNNHAIPNNKYSLSGKINSSFEFDGSNDFIALPELENDIETDMQGTIMFWFNTKRLGGQIFMYTDVTDFERFIRIWTSSKLGFIYRDGTGSWGSNYLSLVTNDTITTNTWNHYLITSDGNTYYVYLNGELQTLTVTGTNNGNWFGDLASADMSTFIGKLHRNNGDDSVLDFYEGQMDEFAITGKYFNASEALAIYTQQYPNYYLNGTYLSDIYNLNNNGFSQINISSSIPTNTTFNLNIKTCNDASCLGENSWDISCNSFPCDLSSLSRNNFIQFLINLSTNNSQLTPSIDSLTIGYTASEIESSEENNNNISTFFPLSGLNSIILLIINLLGYFLFN